MATKKKATASSKKQAKSTVKAKESTAAKKKTAKKTVAKKAAKANPSSKKKAATKTAARKSSASKANATKKTNVKKKTTTTTDTKTSKKKTTQGNKGNSKNGASAAKSIAYKPNPSLLDTPKTAYTPGRRYSDADLQEFKELILEKLEAARKEVTYLQGLITRKGESGTDDTESKFMSVEDGSGTMEREQLSQLASRQIQYIDHLEKALMRIENKTYGICRVTGKLIDKKRLRAVPHATLSIEAKQARSK